MILQNISRGVVGSYLNNISPPDMFLTMLLFEGFHQICQAAFGSHMHLRVKWCTQHMPWTASNDCLTHTQIVL